MRQVAKLYAICILFGGIALLLSLFFRFGFPCPLYWLVGVPCPACGLTRAFISLAGFDVRLALTYHPLFWLVPFMPLVTHPRISARRQNHIWAAFAVIFGVVWVVRMVLYFPHDVPMDFNDLSLLGRVLGG